MRAFMEKGRANDAIRLHLFPYPLQHFLQRPEHFIITEPDNTVSTLCDDFGAQTIVLMLRFMDATVYFDDELMFRTKKIRDEYTNIGLPSPFRTLQFSVAQSVPHFLLRQCHCTA